MIRVGRVPWIAFLLLAGLQVEPRALEAQEGGLDRAERLLGEGRYSESRAELETWLEREWETANRLDRQHGIWLRAVLTIDPGIAQRDYLRLVVEHPGGPYTDQALLRLAQSARVRGEGDEMDRYVGLLEREYPGSLHLPAALALRQEGGDRAPGEGAPPAPLEPAGQDAEPTGGHPPLESLGWAVELGVFEQEPSARSLADHARDAGLDVRLVRIPGSDRVHVRSGSFDGEEEAQARARELRGRGLDARAAPGLEVEVPVP